MKRKIFALTVTAATLAASTVALTATAQTANPVTLYGRVYVAFENVKADGGSAAPVSSRNRVSNYGSSLLGVRGVEDLGGGLKAFFQLETEFRPDNNNSTFANRNSGVGLQGDFGTILLGRWDAPYKTVSQRFDQFGNTTLAGYTAIMADRGNFSRREQNVVQYWSPEFSGFQTRISCTANESKTATVNPVVTSFSANYDRGPVSVSYAYEKHKDIFKNYTGNATNVAGTKEVGQMLGASVKFGPLEVRTLVERFKKNGGGTTLTSDQRSQLFSLAYTTGKSEFVLQMQRSKDGATRANAAAAMAEPNSKVDSIGYFYKFSRRTTLVALYAIVKNNTFGQGNFGANDLTIAAGQDPRGFAIGIRHTF
jgi:predicted porin